jgi:hypothetical protein
MVSAIAIMVGVRRLHAHQSLIHMASIMISITASIMTCTTVSLMAVHIVVLVAIDQTVLVCLLHLQDDVKDDELGCYGIPT